MKNVVFFSIRKRELRKGMTAVYQYVKVCHGAKCVDLFSTESEDKKKPRMSCFTNEIQTGNKEEFLDCKSY